MQGFGVVKSILSGDTLILVGAPKAPNQPAPEIVLGLSNLVAPRISRHPDQKDEPFGWQSREFLRKMTIGRQVKFRIDPGTRAVGDQARQLATVYVCTAPGVPALESVNKAIASAGMAKVVESSGARGDEYESIAAVGRKVQDGNVGLHAHDATKGARNVIWNLTSDQAAALAAELGAGGTKGVPAVIEGVLGGATLRVGIALPGSAPHIMVTFHIAGLQCPRAGGGQPVVSQSEGKAAPAQPVQPGEPYGSEAKAFVESRLLHRDVIVYIGGADKSGAFVGRVEHPAGDIAAELLKGGLGKVVDWSAAFDNPGHVGSLRAAERIAKTGKVKVWSAYEASVSRIPSGAREYTGRVLEAVSGDTLVVLVNPNRLAGTPPDERRVSLASVRAPRLGNARREEKDAPWAWEAKEHLRRLVVGRDVHVAVEYTRAMTEGEGAQPRAGGAGALPDRVYGTVTLETKKGEEVNVAYGLLEAGFIEVAKHRADEDRARDFDRLLEAESSATSAKRGCHSGKEAPLHRIADISSDANKAKAQFPFLKRAGSLRAVVDYAFAGGRVKLFLPSENVGIMFGVAGVRCPAVGKKAGTSMPVPSGKPGAAGAPSGAPRDAEPMGPEALQWMRETVLQCEVEIEAEEVDRNGVILGPLYIGKGGARKNVGAELLKKGLGRGVWPVIERMKDSEELVAAEEEARAAKRGLWAFEPVDEQPDTVAASGNAGSLRLGDAFAALNMDSGADISSVPDPAVPSIPCVLADITDGRQFTLQAEADRGSIDGVNSALDALHDAFGTSHSMIPDIRRGKVVAGLFDDGDGGGKRWYRARIEGKSKAASGSVVPGEEGLERWDVTYMDYGNCGTLTVLSIRPLEASVAAHPPFARRGGLAYLRVPGVKEEAGAEAATALSDAAFGRPLLAHAHGIDTLAFDADASTIGPPRLALELVDGETGSSVNIGMVQAGLARVSRAEARKIRRRLGLPLPPRGIVPSSAFYEQESSAASSKGVSAHTDYIYLRRAESAQDEARRARQGMWRYGDVADSDTEEANTASGQGGKGAWAAKAVKK